jgi:3-keto-5-aminohexanoate cleavage enzyme
MSALPPLVINAALTGMLPRKQDSPHVPVTPEEIAADADLCRLAGASIVHLHARDGGGDPTYRREMYAEIIAAVRERCPDLIVCVSTSGRMFKSFDERSEVLGLEGDLRPDMASLTLGSLNFPREASVTDPQTILRLAETMRERGIVPELEIFDFGMLDYAGYLIGRDVLRPPLYFNFILGSLGTLSATPVNLALLAERRPAGSSWAGAGTGRFQRFVNAMAVTMGGHARVGLEDNLWLDDERTQLATNQQLVQRLADLADAVGRQVADPATARQLIGLV